MSEQGSASASDGALKEAAKESFSTYLEYNKVLRTWFVAFGVGGPALFLVNEKIAQRLASAGMLRDVAAFFLIGVAAQIIGALLNKTTNWYVYIAAYEPDFRETRRHKCAEWYTHQSSIRLVG